MPRKHEKTTEISSFLRALGNGEHGCVFFIKQEDELQILADFLSLGHAQNQLCVYLIATRSREQAQSTLLQAGVDSKLMDDLMIVEGNKLYGSAEHPDVERWALEFDQLYNKTTALGKNGLRIAADLSSFFLERGLVDEWFKLENALGRKFEKRATILCAYDISLITAKDAGSVLAFYREFGPSPKSSYIEKSHSFAIFPIEKDKALILTLD